MPGRPWLHCVLNNEGRFFPMKRPLTAAKLFKALFVVLSLLTLGNGCATLPNVSETISEAPTNGGSPQIASAKGPLSLKQSRALMERLKRSVEATDMLQRYTTVIESVSR